MGGTSSGGGDEVGLEFLNSFSRAMSELKERLPEIYSQLYASDLEGIAKSAKVIVVDDALDIQVKNLIQSSVATNSPLSKTVLINRKRWREIQDQRLKQAIALHEVLSLRGLEQTGYYPFSSQYVSRQGASIAALDSGLKVDRFKQLMAENPQASPYEILVKFFNEAQSAPEMSDFDPFPSYGNEKLTCVQSGRADQKLRSVPIFKRARMTLKAEVPPAGPLFPGEPAIVEDRIVFGAESAQNSLSPSLREYSFALYFDWTHSPGTISYAPNEITERVNGFAYEGGVTTSYAHVTLSFRKNNGLITFKTETLQTYPAVGSDTEATEGPYVSYGYCYLTKP